MTTLEYSRISRHFGAVAALDNFSLTVPGGKLVTLLGPSGCGKTTALRLAAGFDIPSGGNLLMNGHVMNHVPAQRRGVGMVFQSYSLFPHMTVAENVEYGLRVRKVPAPDRRRRTGEMLELVQISDLAARYPHQISGGQQQRVALARALVFEPAILLLDEPLSALDAKVRTEVRDAIRDLQRRLGTTTLFVTHDQHEAFAVSDLVCVMNEGRIHQVGTPQDVYMRPSTEFVARFVGETVRLELRDSTVLVRPENMSVTTVREAAISEAPSFVGYVCGIDFHGATSTVRVSVTGSDTVLPVRVLPHQASRLALYDEVGVIVTSTAYTE